MMLSPVFLFQSTLVPPSIGGLFVFNRKIGNSLIDIPYGGIVYLSREVIRNDDPGQFAGT